MPSCAVKWCISQSHLHKKNDGISFHVFPQDHYRRKVWTKAVQLERQDPEWTPSKTRKICSIHFRDDDFYVTKKGHKKLKSNAFPICTMVFSNEKSLQSTRLKMRPLTQLSICKKDDIIDKSNPEMISKSQKSNLVACPSCGCEFDVPVDSATEDLGSLRQPSPLTNSKIPDARCGTPLNIPSSEIESTLNTPETHRLQKLVQRKTLLSEKRLCQIRNLNRRNKRLVKKIMSLKDVITFLKQKKFVDT